MTGFEGHSKVLFLVDTNVISAGAPARSGLHSDLAGWMDRNADRLFVSAITVAEIEDGIAKMRRVGADRKAHALTAWLETLLHLYDRRVLVFDIPAARHAGRLSDEARANGLAIGFPDLAIAATAHVHGLIVLTRNIRHFGPLPVRAHDPFVRLPEERM